MAKTTKKARNPGVTRAIFYFSHKNDPLRFPTITEFRGKQLSHPRHHFSSTTVTPASPSP